MSGVSFRAGFLAGASLCAALAAAQPAAAQVVANNRELQVNPQAAGGGTALLYPGGQYMRSIRPLLQPGETIRDRGPVALHMPSGRTRVAVARTTPRAEAAVPAEPRVAAAPQPPPASKPAPKVAAAPKPAPTQAPVQAQANLAASSPQGAAGLDLGNLTPTRPLPSNPVQTARNTPPPSTVTAPAAASGANVAGLIKRSVILFAPDSSDPAEAALGAIKFLAGDLSADMNTPTARIQVQAFGGRRGDKGSDARRLSLKRALAIRQVLIDDGVAAERIDVRAMGGADDSGPADRVDVYIKA